MFKEIHIQNFRGIKDLKINDFKQVNLFVGANNSGKTSVLEALFLALSPSNPASFQDLNAIRGLMDLKIANNNSFLDTLHNSLESLFYRLNNSSPIVLTCQFKDPLQTRVIKIKPIFSSTLTTQKDSKDISSTSTELKSYWKGLDFSCSISGLNKKNKSLLSNFSSKAILIHENDQQGKMKIGFESIHDSEYMKKLKSEEIKEFKGKYIGHSSGINDAFNLVSLFDEIKIQRRKQELLDLLKDLELSIKDIDFLKESFYVDLEGFGKLVRYEILGQGTKKIFSLACNILGDAQNLSEGSVLFIDEIENGLHYSSQDKLWKWLFKVAKEKNIQIFATTHSEDCEKSFIKASKEFVDSLEKKSTTNSKNKTRKEDLDPSRLYRLEKKLDHTFRVEPYDYKSLDVSINDLGVETR